MSAFDLFSEFDDALEWLDDDDPLLDPVAPPPWPGDDADAS